MDVTFYGAAREVTGSMHLLALGKDRILFDCGMFQGRRRESEEKNRIVPFEPGSITNIILSHAHIDHSGRIPVLTKKGFSGRIICTRATASVCNYLLKDSAKIQESDAEYLNYKSVRGFLSRLKTSDRSGNLSPGKIKELKKLLKKGRHKINRETVENLMDKHGLEKIQPLYSMEDADNALTQFDGRPYNRSVTIGNNIICTFYDAGHILGSALCMVKAKEKGRTYNICFTGDYGRFGKPIIKNPTISFEEKDRDIDLLIIESTYGNRFHEPIQDMKQKIKQVIIETYNRGGSVLIPSFAFGRAQELVYVLHELYDEGEVPRIPVFVDSPLASNLTKVFGEHPEVYNVKSHKTFLEKGKNPFSFPQIKFVQSVEESMALMRDERPNVVIASSGMCEAGRILHHLRCKIHNQRHTILIVGYMAANTLGRRILEQGIEYEKSGRNGPAPILKFYNKEYPLNTRVVKLGGFSAHADKNELLKLINESNLRVKKIAVVHGEKDQALSFAEHLKKEGFSVTVPHAGDTLEVD